MADRNNPQNNSQNNWGRSNQLSPVYYQGPTPWSPPPIFDANLQQPYRYVQFSFISITHHRIFRASTHQQPTVLIEFQPIHASRHFFRDSVPY